MESAIIPTQEQLIKFYERCPNIILYGLTNIAIQDRWALLALVGYCHVGMHPNWTLDELEGPYKLSLREIATITGIDHTALRKRAGKDKRDGVLDRLQQLGYVTILDARPLDEITGQPAGRPQTYLYIHLRKLWEDNLTFNETHRIPTGKPINPRDLEVIVDATVDVVNSRSVIWSVDHVNNHVDNNNSSVDVVNKNVDRGNDIVDGARSNSAQDYRRPIRQKEEKERPSPFFEIETEVQGKRRKGKLPSLVESDVIKATNQFGERGNLETNKEAIAQIYHNRPETIDVFDFRMIFESGKNEAMRYPDKSAYLLEYLRKKCKLSSTSVSVPA